MRQDMLDGLVTFVTVAEEKSFSAAAVRLGVSPSAVSQSISKLEGRMRLALFNRTTRSVSLTEAGLRYLERVVPAVHDLTAAAQELGEAVDKPAGLLRINVARSGYMIALQPILRDFLDTYPDIELEVRIEGSLVDIVGQGFDAGVRFGDLVQRDMVTVKIGPAISAHIIAAPGYLGRYGIPRHPRDLLHHNCISFRHSSSGQIERWEFEKDGEKIELAVNGRLILNDSAALTQAALDGIGIAYMINGYIDRFLDDGRLVRILSDWAPSLAGLALYYPDRRRVPAKLRALIDFLRQRRQVEPPQTAGAFT
ncbi:LysR family transcriptional regulator [Agrobacterium rhizogenes]|uniref:LysR family transcriptional regulator n=1 Tax=Rhizobium rhizogenes TaxID=359 RepID=UPI001574BF0D|nr:LysR family transcriptional regulator [Rhizobium rhizogenes]NTG85028.1 LysR family transcriptional regulator [Rhizobium rhizogenes]NTI14517.1 LysR family transcriptional regulator [Rhizobium rhizogenes]